MSSLITKLGVKLGFIKQRPTNEMESALSANVLGDLAASSEAVYQAEASRTSLEPPIAPRSETAAFARLEEAPAPSLPLPAVGGREVEEPDTEPLEPTQPKAKPRPTEVSSGNGWDALDF